MPHSNSSPDNDIPSVSSEPRQYAHDDVRNVVRLCGGKATAVWLIARSNAASGEPNDIASLSIVLRMSAKKIREHCACLQAHGLIRLEEGVGQRSVARVAVDRSRYVGIVYLLSSGDRYKIGVTTSLQRRLDQLNSSQPPFPIEVVFHVETAGYLPLESLLHEKYGGKRVHGEWFVLSADDVLECVAAMDDWRKANSGEGDA